MDHGLAFVADHGLGPFPAPADAAQAAAGWEQWNAAAEAAEPALARAMAACGALAGARDWLEAIFGNSPYLTRLALREPAAVVSVFRQGPDASLDEVLTALNAEDARQPRAAVMARLRRAKRRAALIAALADIAGAWPLERVTEALSALAAAALSLALRHQLLAAAAAGQLELAQPEDPERDCGIIVLAMGKLGAFELNYSSDIDLIILFDPDKVRYRGRDSVPAFAARLARDLVKLMEERTADGYVFRTDLRLRPDPASTPPAVSVGAAETYYGSLGQNWERAAMIKARPVAGDLAAGHAFLRALTPFLWRKHLDFAAIRDIHSIKRQIDARHGAPAASLAGANIKLGHGGIREIEFFAQTQQLIWGGRMPVLRCRGTVETLEALAALDRIERPVAQSLIEAYRFLRRVEHRLQMIDDQQTHSLPTEPAAMRRLALFLGYDGAAAMTDRLRAVLTRVQRHFRELFGDAPALSAEGNLVFTGTESDPETLATLGRLGFAQPERVAETIRGWHHGRLRATRSERARELLTEITPALLRVIGRTADPDLAFTRFGEFLAGQPAGVQLLSLFERQPELLHLVAEIMGESPLLAIQLARRPDLLDGVLTGAFFEPLPPAEDDALRLLREDLALALGLARDYEDLLNLARRWAADRRFQIGVQLLQRRLAGERAGRDFTLVAEAVIGALLPAVEAEFAGTHGRVPGGAFAVLGLGKLGSREMNVLSDLDLIFVYDADPSAEQSDGRRPLPVTGYFARLGQRVINALAAPTGEGSLYEVDMRLRPSGNAGPIASSLAAFRRYHDEQAWTWERMALTRARVVAGDAALGRRVGETIRAVLCRPRDPDRLLADVADMRQRIARAHPAPKPWDAKHRPGALVDLEFIAQYLELRAAPDAPAVLCWRTADAFARLAEAGRLDPAAAATCLDALRFWLGVQQMLRVSLGKVESAEVAPALLDRALARATEGADADARLAALDRAAAAVREVYDRLIERPAARLSGA